MKETIILALIVLAIALFVILIEGPEPDPDTTKDQTTESARLMTVEHDGHLWIVPRWNLSGSTVHHPDCKCKQLSHE